MNNPPRREAQTEIDPTMLIRPRPAAGTLTPVPTSETDAQPPADSDKRGECTLRDGTKIVLRELDGEDESAAEVLADQLGVTLGGATKATYTRVMALASVDTIDGKEQAPVRYMEQLKKLMKYKSPDQLTIMVCYQRFVTEAAAGAGTFPSAR